MQRTADQVAEEKLHKIDEKIVQIHSLNKVTAVNKSACIRPSSIWKRPDSPRALQKEKEDLETARSSLLRKSQRDRLVDLYNLLELSSNSKCRSKLKGTRAPCDTRDTVLKIDLEGYYGSCNKASRRKFTSAEKLRRSRRLLRSEECRVTWEMLRKAKYEDVCRNLGVRPLELAENTEEDERIMKRVLVGKVKLPPIQEPNVSASRINCLYY